MKILFADTLYPDFLKTHKVGVGSYDEELQRLMRREFGTSDYYSRQFRALGWETFDVIANHLELQRLWIKENEIPGRQRFDPTSENILLNQIGHHDPDVLFMQDLSALPVSTLRYLKTPENCDPGYQANKMPELVGQLSCPWPGDERVKRFDILFTSFPHYVERIQKLGVQAVYVPLAFEESVLDETVPMANIDGEIIADVFRQRPEQERIHDCVFIGGVGNPSHWKRGMETLELVAREIPTFKWWGYGVATLPENSILRQKYQGQAFGRDMYEILLRSKIVLNRHGEVSEGYTNNMRTYEATGTGALLLTEESKNIWELFSAKELATYLTPQHAVDKIRYYLEHEEERATIAANGQRRTLKDHTYGKRMKQVSDVLIGALQAA